MEFKELMALKPAKPIITMGTEPVFCDVELHNDVIVNVKQIERMKAAPKEVPAEPVPPPKPKTKAELRRERMAARREERNRQEAERRAARMAARMAEVEARHPDDDDSDDEEEAPAAAPLGAVMDRLVARVAGAPAPVAAARPAIRANINAPEVVAEVNAKDPGMRRMKFWEIVARLQWHNSSDGAIGQGAVNAVLNALTAVDLKIFAVEYNALFAGAIDFLRDNGMFIRNGAATMESQAKIVSHVIALGEDQYITLINDPEILQFLVEAGECQSLNALLPDDVRV